MQLRCQPQHQTSGFLWKRGGWGGGGGGLCLSRGNRGALDPGGGGGADPSPYQLESECLGATGAGNLFTCCGIIDKIASGGLLWFWWVAVICS